MVPVDAIVPDPFVDAPFVPEIPPLVDTVVPVIDPLVVPPVVEPPVFPINSVVPPVLVY